MRAAQCDRRFGSPIVSLSNLQIRFHKLSLEDFRMIEAEAKQLALGLAVLCVRNTCIEDIHSGAVPGSPAGDFSDVKVASSRVEIPWNAVSRISDDEMRAFMIQVVDSLYTSLLRLNDPAF